MFSWSLLIKTWWLQWVSIKVDQCFLFEITMLRKRSRTTVPSKQALMAENGSPKDKNLKPTTSLFSSPRLFSVLSSSSSKVLSESDCVKSPTSILDNKPFSGFGNPFWSDNRNLAIHEAFPLENRHPWEKNFDSGVGLGIVDALNDEEHNQKFSNNPNSRMVLFGSQLKIQIPPIPSLLLSSFESPKSPNDFGIKTYAARKSPFGSSNSGLETPNSPKIFTGCLSATEMECSEDYTCVITHGPNPRTTHIFDDCIVENCCGVVGFSASKEEEICSDQSEYPSESFLSFCCTCKKNLEQGKDIYMYRGEKAFCSHECRNQEILIDEGKEKSGLDIDST